MSGDVGASPYTDIDPTSGERARWWNPRPPDQESQALSTRLSPLTPPHLQANITNINKMSNWIKFQAIYSFDILCVSHGRFLE